MSSATVLAHRSPFAAVNERYLKKKAACQALGIPITRFEEQAETLLFDLAACYHQHTMYPLSGIQSVEQPDGSYKLVGGDA